MRILSHFDAIPVETNYVMESIRFTRESMKTFTTGFRPKDGPAKIMSIDEIAKTMQERESTEAAFWQSPKIFATISAELPFWLMIKPCSIDLIIAGCPAQASIFQNLVAVHEGDLSLQSNNNLVTVISDGQPIQLDTGDSYTRRPMKTVIEFDTYVHSAAIENWTNRGQVKSDDHSAIAAVNYSMQYFSALAHGHIPYLNKLIHSYRSTSFDPFVMEVSEWDVSNWYLETADSFVSISLMPYQSLDFVPDIGELGSIERSKYVATSQEAVQAQSRTDLAAGKIQILDAKSLMFRGRYTEAIRSAVTAIEVAVEEKYKEAATQRGQSAELTLTVLEETKMNFFNRIHQLEMLLGRRLPGPRSFRGWLNENPDDPLLAPYLNGVRLRDELQAVRNLRHDFVHRGMSINPYDRGPALRAIETMTWLFEWVDPTDQFSGESTKNYGFFSLMRGVFHLVSTASADGVSVEAPQISSTKLVFPKDYLLDVYKQTLVAGKEDIDLFVAMTLAALGVSYQDAPPTEAESRWAHEEFHAVIDGRNTLVFCPKASQRIDVGVTSRVIARIKEVEEELGEPVRSIIVMVGVMEQLRKRRSDPELTSTIEMIKQARCSLVDAAELGMIIRATEKHELDIYSIEQCIFVPGVSKCMPKQLVTIGSLKRPLPKFSAISVSLAPEKKIERGDQIYFLESNELCSCVALGLQINHEIVDTATGPCDVGVEVGNEIPPIKNGSILMRIINGEGGSK